MGRYRVEDSTERLAFRQHFPHVVTDTKRVHCKTCLIPNIVAHCETHADAANVCSAMNAYEYAALEAQRGGKV